MTSSSAAEPESSLPEADPAPGSTPPTATVTSPAIPRQASSAEQIDIDAPLKDLALASAIPNQSTSVDASQGPETAPSVPPPTSDTEPTALPQVLLWTILAAALPGIAHLKSGRRRWGIALLSVTIMLILATCAALIFPLALATRVGSAVTSHPSLTHILMATCIVGSVVWALLVVWSYRLLKPAKPGRVASTLGTILVCALVAGVLAPGAYGARVAHELHDMYKIFGAEPTVPVESAPQVKAADPWAGVNRVNILLIGSDADEDRPGSRTDSLNVASIDPATGSTVLIGLPRNLQRVPFPPGSPGAEKWPKGFHCYRSADDVCMINEITTWADENRSLYGAAGQDPRFPLTVLMDVVGEVTGLRIDQWFMVSIGGFRDVVNAVGGVRYNLKRDIPVGVDGHPVDRWIKAGNRKYDGEDALWISRSRRGSDDYDRMRRQRCMLNALATQIDPAALAARLPALIKSAKDHVATSVPPSQINAYVDLSKRVQKGDRVALTFDDRVILTRNPDFVKMRSLISSALTAPPVSPDITAPPTIPTTAPLPTAGEDGENAEPENGQRGRTPRPAPTTPVALENECA